jgi:hypothetical protein
VPIKQRIISNENQLMNIEEQENERKDEDMEEEDDC